ncbi:ras-related protein Rab-10-like isoform X2 [Argiope bruennichi]|uniref:Ras-related protein RABB1c like protein n=1 Tax=Argiope bruennichi TaxID=94029 RepID=A0A8T0E903_ARGBR|nr:ras-related protein Rab-10-like isoform X2 [Argiope bruennichi]KAF8767954.1 Ras-related protein RABB1c like protein [Argiope bruennichi]
MAADHHMCIIMLGEMKEHKSTLIVDNFSKTIILKDIPIDLYLWDTAGQERYKAIIKEYYRKADGVLLVYDMTNHASFMELPSWLRYIREQNEDATVFIVGNKADLRHLNQVSGTTAENFAREEGLEFHETSAKNNENVDDVFEKLALKVLERKRIPPFYNEIQNGDIEATNLDNTVTETSAQPAEMSLPPILRLENEFRSDDQVIKLSIEKPRKEPKPKKSCC